MITLGTGVGGGLIIDNKIYTGQSGNAMEVGHMTIRPERQGMPLRKPRLLGTVRVGSCHG